MFLIITEQTEQVLYIIGAFVIGIIISSIATYLGNNQVKKLEKKQAIRLEMLKLFSDIQKNSSENSVFLATINPINIMKDINRIFKSYLLAQSHYKFYRIYFKDISEFEAETKKFNDIYTEFLKIDILNIQKNEEKSLFENYVEKLVSTFRRMNDLMTIELSISLFNMSKQEKNKKIKLNN